MTAIPPVEAGTKVKICGLCREADAEMVNRLRPDYVGLVFAANRRRTLTTEKAASISRMLAKEIVPVGVFLNQEIGLIASLARAGIIRAVQLHGQEDESYLSALRALLPPGTPVIKAFPVLSERDVTASLAFPSDYVLFDGKEAGSGQPFDHRLALRVTRPFFLAGGLTPENVSAALACRPYAVDVSSGVENAQTGEKDFEKMKRFLEAVRKGSGKERSNNMQNARGRFGQHGGQYIPETLMNAVTELEEAYGYYKNDPAFRAELDALLRDYAGRPSLLYEAKKLTETLGGAKIYLKREDLNHTGAHKINNVLGQALLAKKMGKTRLIAETGAGQHGVATATAAALLGLRCKIFMGKEDTERQALNVYKMRLLGAEVVSVTTGTATLKDAVSEAMREWSCSVEDTHYCLGSVMGPHPFPTIVRDFQSVISLEMREQILKKEGRLPDAVIACVGGGSNAIGSFYHFIGDREVRLIGCEAAGRGIDTRETAATINTGRLGIFHGMKSYFCQDEYGQIAPVYSISAGLDYPGVGPEHAFLHDTGRAEYVAVTDSEAVWAFEFLSRTEGIIPAIESAHALAHAMELAPSLPKEKILIVTLSGRGDKDCAAIARYRGQDAGTV